MDGFGAAMWEKWAQSGKFGHGRVRGGGGGARGGGRGGWANQEP